ncbi:MAG: SAM-dependent methyltransferase [Thermoleophilia bacterium]|nr:SAM-dependent methyltransferase [Thermoleophilia bacterium]
MVEVFEPYAGGLDDVDGFSHVHLLYRLYVSGPPALKVTPVLDDSPRGVFGTRAPERPAKTPKDQRGLVRPCRLRAPSPVADPLHAGRRRTDSAARHSAPAPRR